MTLTERIESPPIDSRRRSSRRTALRQADLGDLVVEVQARLDEQSIDHAAMSRLILADRGRDAVSDTLMAKAIQNARHQVDHGGRDEQMAAVARIEKVHADDERADDNLIAALMGMLGIHNADAHDLRRLIRDNARAITDGAPVALPAEAAEA